MLNLYSVNALLFVASLVDYTAVLYEDSSINAMRECLHLFQNLTGMHVFRYTTIILLLNKDDLLQRLLEKTPNNGLKSCFSAEGGWQNKNEYWDTTNDDKYVNNELDMIQFHKIVVQFILQLFKNRREHMFYNHVVVAIDSHIVDKVFDHIQRALISIALISE